MLPIRCVTVAGRNPIRARATVREIRALISDQVHVDVTQSIERSVADADTVSSATSSVAAILQGEWTRPGTFIGLVGSFSPTKREADDETMRRSRVFVDTFEGALAEAGDLLDPIRRGVLGRDRIEGELGDLIAGRSDGRGTPHEITLFKSVGSAIEDLATAQLAFDLGRGHRCSDMSGKTSDMPTKKGIPPLSPVLHRMACLWLLATSSLGCRVIC
jgi:ornithine cyclodeaminase/alanine dehydrogenase-like protein (mu-crystallin family)